MTSCGVVALHGQPGSGRCFEQLRGLLGPSVVVDTPDRPGWGASEHDATDLLEQAAWVVRRLHGPSVVVGYSLGAAVAVLAAAASAEVAGLVLVAPAVTRRAVLAVDHVLGWWGVGHVAGGVLAALAERSLRQVWSMSTGRAFHLEQRSLLAHVEAVEEALGALSVPVVVVAGLRDRVVPPHSVLDALARLPSASLVTVPDGHDVIQRHPGVVADAIRQLVHRCRRGDVVYTNGR